jgi:3-oxoadipate enol-lactonase
MRAEFGVNTIGYEDRGRGEPIVLLHGFPLDRRMWEPVIRLVEHHVRVIAPDLRGAGESTGTGTIEDMADDVVRLLDRLRIERVCLGGMSMGGYVALAISRKHPERLAGLLLADTRATADAPEGRAAREAAIATVAAKGVGPYAEEFVPKLLAPANAKGREVMVALAALQSPTGIAGALAAMRDRPDGTKALKKIQVPTLVVVGALDTLIPPAESKKLAAAIPGAELIEIPNAGHLSSVDAPDPFANAIEQLLRMAR